MLHRRAAIVEAHTENTVFASAVHLLQATRTKLHTGSHNPLLSLTPGTLAGDMLLTIRHH